MKGYIVVNQSGRMFSHTRIKVKSCYDLQKNTKNFIFKCASLGWFKNITQKLYCSAYILF
jgi:hypothetical protein